MIQGRPPHGGEISSTDTAIKQFRLPVDGGTNNVAKDASERTTDFTLTGLGTTNGVDFSGWVLEITESGYEQKVYIASNTNANPGVAHIRSNYDAEAVSGEFNPELPASGNVAYEIYPLLLSPVSITFNRSAIGTLTLYRSQNTTSDPLNKIAVLRAGQSIAIPSFDLSQLAYQFSTHNTSTQKFVWCEGEVSQQPDKARNHSHAPFRNDDDPAKYHRC